MFGLGFLEIALVAMVAVVLFPPTELPKLARSIARFYGSIRRVADDFRTTVLQDEELSRPVREIRSAYQETRWKLRQAEEAARRDLARAQAQVKSATDPVAPRKQPEGTVANASSSTSTSIASAPPPVPAVATSPSTSSPTSSSSDAATASTAASSTTGDSSTPANAADSSSQTRPGAA